MSAIVKELLGVAKRRKAGNFAEAKKTKTLNEEIHYRGKTIESQWWVTHLTNLLKDLPPESETKREPLASEMTKREYFALKLFSIRLYSSYELAAKAADEFLAALNATKP